MLIGMGRHALRTHICSIKKTRSWPEGKAELEAYPDDLPPTSTHMRQEKANWYTRIVLMCEVAGLSSLIARSCLPNHRMFAEWIAMAGF